MTYIIHQTVGVVLNPLFFSIAMLITGMIFLWRKRRRTGWTLLLGCLLTLILTSLPITNEFLIRALEDRYPVRTAEKMPSADAILLLGGGLASFPKESEYPYVELRDSADRAWHAARLYHAGKAKKIYCTAPDVSMSSPPFLKALGVLDEDIITFDGPHNTQEEVVRFAKELGVAWVLLVTSAMHMPRAVKIFRKYAPSLECIPAATDYQAIHWDGQERSFRSFIPSSTALAAFNTVWHELLGLLRYGF